VGRFKRWRATVASVLVLALAAGAFVVLAISSPGYSVQRADLNDGGVWVTNDTAGLFGRLNKPVGKLDGGFYPPGQAATHQLDVVQQDAAVVAWDQGGGLLLPVNVTKALADQTAKVTVSGGSSATVLLSGGTLAVLDPVAGKVWAERVQPGTGVTSLAAVDSAAPALADVGSGAAMTVGTDGTVYAASSTTHREMTLSPSAAGFADPTTSDLSSAVVGDIRMTAVGNTPVVLDAQGHLAAGAVTATLPSATGAVLQQAGTAAAGVLVQTGAALLSLPLAGGDPSTVVSGGSGTAAPPVLLGGCAFAVWSGSGASGVYGRSCDGTPTVAAAFPLKDSNPRLVFRVNRGFIVVNDSTAGTVWTADNTPAQVVDSWTSVTPPTRPKDQQNQNNLVNDQQKNISPPKAVDDALGARPGRSTVLHVLDNDSDPGGAILSIASVTGLSDPTATAVPSPDGQTVLLSTTAAAHTVRFSYTIDNGKGLTATAAVTVEPRIFPTDNKVPALRPGFTPTVRSIASGGTVSLPVLGDWRDFDGDPVQLIGATVGAGRVSTTPDGRVVYQAPVTPGPQTVTYQVSDGVGEPVSGTIAFTVLDPASTTAQAATTAPDVAHGVVGQPVVVHPLANDLPGLDPLTPTARLTLAGQVASPAGALVTTDLAAGTVTLTGQRAGTFLLSYSAAFGNAPFAPGTIRVDVTAPPPAPLPPIAMPDTSVLHGQGADVVDVLANDVDPGGGVLVVQKATVAGTNPQLQVAVVQGHWLRINALVADLSPKTQVVTYTVTNGAATVTGEVTVTQLAAPEKDTPVTTDDYATVRAGDSTSMPVLDNDTNPGGSPISLVQDVPGAPTPGQLTVTSTGGATADLGTAYVSGNLVRYVAPATVTTPQTVTVEYVAQDPNGNSATGKAHITITPLPTASNPDLPPIPVSVEARTVAGDTITIPIRTTGTDPDGDSTTVTGIASPTTPGLGRVLSVGPTSLRYQAYPTGASGTDSFTYTVTDRFGLSATAAVRVAVVAPGDPQPPVAVPDVVTAAPGAQLTVDVMRNDVVALDDTATLQPLADSNPSLPSGVALSKAGDQVELTAPPADGKPLVITYGISNGLTAPSTTTLTVRGQDGYIQPPVAADAFAVPTPDATSVDVDLADKISDPASTAPVTISKVFADGATVSGTTVSLPVGRNPQTVAYQVTNNKGATGMAVVHVPAVGSGAPYVKADATIAVDRNSTKTVTIADYVTDPASKPLQLTTTDTITATPTAGLSVVSQGATQLVLTAAADYTGPAAITFQVTDGATLDDPAGQKALLTVSVQVGTSTPILRCPTDPLTVVEGGNALTVDVTSVCHVWVPDASTRASLTYNASWATQPAGVTLDGSGTGKIVVTAGGSAAPGSTGTISVSSGGGVAGTIAVAVTAARSPSISPITVDGVKAGDTATISVAQYVQSELKDKAISVVSATQISGSSSTVSTSGAQVTIAPAPTSNGTMTYSVVVSDVADATRTDRQVTGLITLHVLGVPDAPGTPTPDRTVQSQVVQLSWATPANNGAPIDSYEVSGGGVTQTCASSPCAITGLHNGTTYSFTVRAHNLVGFGQPSRASAGAVPNEVPGAATALVASAPRDGALTLNWGAAPVNGTPVTSYLVTWGNGGSQTVSGTSATPSGLVNDTAYTFTVIAVNAQGPGPAVTATGQSSGAPVAVGAPTFASTSTANKSTRAVTVSWTGVDPNGLGPTLYTVNRTGGGSPKTVCTDSASTRCLDDGLPNDGTIYTYTVTARNQAVGGANHTAPASAGTQVEATATPDSFTNVSSSPTGADGTAKLAFDAPASHGKTNTVTCTVNGTSCGSWTYPPNGQPGQSKTISGLTNGNQSTITLQDCNGSGGTAQAGDPCGAPASTTVTTYGPLRQPTVNASANGRTVSWNASATGNGKSAHVTIQTSTQRQDYDIVGAGSWSGTDTLGFSTTDTITVTVSDSSRSPGSASASAQATTATQPPPSLTVGVGGYGTTSYCTISACRNIVVTVRNFEPNSTFTLWYDTDCAGGNATQQTACGGGVNAGKTHYASEQVTVDNNGNKDVSDRYFGYPGSKVWVDGNTRGMSVESNHCQF
jgi:hypothetical protein